MSYSFTITADSKAEACAKVRNQFDAVVVAQPSHATDKEPVVVAAQALIRLLQEPGDGKEITVSVYGSLGWNWTATDDKPLVGEFTSAGANISIGIRDRV